MKLQTKEFLINNRDYFSDEDLSNVAYAIDLLNEDSYLNVSLIKFKHPMLMQIISFVFGLFGADRFILGDTGMGVLKLLTFGGLGIIAVYDYITVMRYTREKNYKLLIEAVSIETAQYGEPSVPAQKPSAAPAAPAQAPVQRREAQPASQPAPQPAPQPSQVYYQPNIVPGVMPQNQQEAGEKLEKLRRLREFDVISEREYENRKKELLGGSQIDYNSYY